jgi:hypothetical protein
LGELDFAPQCHQQNCKTNEHLEKNSVVVIIFHIFGKQILEMDFSSLLFKKDGNKNIWIL